MKTVLLILAAWTLISMALVVPVCRRLHEIGKDYEDEQ